MLLVVALCLMGTVAYAGSNFDAAKRSETIRQAFEHPPTLAGCPVGTTYVMPTYKVVVKGFIFNTTYTVLSVMRDPYDPSYLKLLLEDGSVKWVKERDVVRMG